MSIKQVLMDARELISNEENWCQGALARDASGAAVDESSPEACQWCAIGALIASSSSEDEWEDAERKLKEQLDDRFRLLAHFNDTHIHAEVLDLFEKAIASL